MIKAALVLVIAAEVNKVKASKIEAKIDFFIFISQKIIL